MNLEILKALNLRLSVDQSRIICDFPNQHPPYGTDLALTIAHFNGKEWVTDGAHDLRLDDRKKWRLVRIFLERNEISALDLDRKLEPMLIEAAFHERFGADVQVSAQDDALVLCSDVGNELKQVRAEYFVKTILNQDHHWGEMRWKGFKPQVRQGDQPKTPQHKYKTDEHTARQAFRRLIYKWFAGIQENHTMVRDLVRRMSTLPGDAPQLLYDLVHVQFPKVAEAANTQIKAGSGIDASQPVPPKQRQPRKRQPKQGLIEIIDAGPEKGPVTAWTGERQETRAQRKPVIIRKKRNVNKLMEDI